jgi:hypothetical protein
MPLGDTLVQSLCQATERVSGVLQRGERIADSSPKSLKPKPLRSVTLGARLAEALESVCTT